MTQSQVEHCRGAQRVSGAGICREDAGNQSSTQYSAAKSNARIAMRQVRGGDQEVLKSSGPAGNKGLSPRQRV